jgi:hypothetical protein
MNAKRALPLLMSTLAVATAATFAVPAHAQVFNKYFVEGSSGAYSDHAGWRYNVWGSGDPLGGSMFGNPNFNGTSYNFAGSTTDTTGRATSFVANTNWTAPNQISVNALAGADLATASLRASVTGGEQGGSAFARAHDILNFTVAGANASTRTRVQMEWSIDGRMFEVGPRDQYNNVPSARVQATMCMNMRTSFGCGVAVESGEYYRLSATSNILWGNGEPNKLVTSSQEGDWGSWVSSTPDLMKFTGSFDLIGSSIQLNPDFQLLVGCRAGAQCDYGNTAKFRFVDLPSNVSFTSDSGVFLANMSPVSAVPEPETYTLMMAGLSLMGWVARRRKS